MWLSKQHHSTSPIAGLHHKLTIFLVCLSAYSIIITIFYFKNPVQRFRYLSVHIKKVQEPPFGSYPLFDPVSHCNGCDRIRMNAGDTKTISNIDFLVLIPSAPENHSLRQRIRSTWGSAPTRFRRRQLYFFIGLTNDTESQRKIFRENTSWKDIIQPDFLDDFKNLTLKSLSMLYWVHFRLADKRFNPRFIFKCDDDNLVDIFQLEDYLETLDMYDDEIVCAVREEAVPARIGHEKKFIDAETWNEPLYPRCCFGPAYFIAPSAISELIMAHESETLPFVPYEDVYITGILTRAANITLTHFPPHLYSDTPDREKVIMHQALTKFGGFELDVRWELMQRDAFGNETYEEIKAQKEEENIAKQLRWKEQKLLQEKQGLVT